MNNDILNNDTNSSAALSAAPAQKVLTINVPGFECIKHDRKPTGRTLEYGNVFDSTKRHTDPEYVATVETMVGDIAVTIDVQAIIQQLGVVAMRSKTGKAVRFDGLVTARVIRRSVTSETREEARPLPEGTRYV